MRSALFAIDPSKASDQSHVFGVRADPEPDDAIAILCAKGSPAKRDPDGVDGRVAFCRLEAERRMVGVAFEVPVRTNRLPLNDAGQAAKTFIELF